MKFCSNCASTVTLSIPQGDSLPRHVCDACGTIHYQNPKIVAGCLPMWEDKILICRRAIEPRYGKWTLPAGFMGLEAEELHAVRMVTRTTAGNRIACIGFSYRSLILG